jgi:hypothetical protein
MKLNHDTEIQTLKTTHQREKKILIEHNLELWNTVQSLKVSAAFIHLTALLLGAVIFLCITGPTE